MTFIEKSGMKIKDYIQNNPFRIMGVFTNDSSGIISTHRSRMKAYAAIGKTPAFPLDLSSVFGSEPNRKTEALVSSMSTLSTPEERLRNGLFWFMNLTDTDAKALAALAQDGDLLVARHIWENGEQNMSSLQNQLMCCLLKDPRSYSKALQLASTLYSEYGHDFIVVVCNGLDILSPEKLMTTFLGEIIQLAGDDCRWWDKAVKRYGDAKVGLQWAEVKVIRHTRKLQDALNVAKTTEIHSPQDNHIVATSLMKLAEPHLKALKSLKDNFPIFLSRYSTIADAVCEEVLDHEITYYNLSKWFPKKKAMLFMLERFCYRYAATLRFRERCRLNINITLSREKDAPLFPNGMPDKLLNERERNKRNAGICGIVSALQNHNVNKLEVELL